MQQRKQNKTFKQKQTNEKPLQRNQQITNKTAYIAYLISFFLMCKMKGKANTFLKVSSFPDRLQYYNCSYYLWKCKWLWINQLE